EGDRHVGDPAECGCLSDFARADRAAAGRRGADTAVDPRVLPRVAPGAGAAGSGHAARRDDAHAGGRACLVERDRPDQPTVWRTRSGDIHPIKAGPRRHEDPTVFWVRRILRAFVPSPSACCGEYRSNEARGSTELAGACATRWPIRTPAPPR